MLNSGLREFENIINNLNNKSYFKKDSEGNDILVNFQMNDPATEENINALEESLGGFKRHRLYLNKLRFKIPRSYKEFLLKYNGGTIYSNEKMDGYILLGTEDMVNINLKIQETDILVFCKFTGDKFTGEMKYLGFDLKYDRWGEYRVVGCVHEEIPEEWFLIADNFNKWLELLILNEGSEFWDKNGITKYSR